MGIINRIALLILTIISTPILLILAVISPNWYLIYQMYLTEMITKFLNGK